MAIDASGTLKEGVSFMTAYDVPFTLAVPKAAVSILRFSI
jgi:hypothetical protein